jgi:hypothetical protein
MGHAGYLVEQSLYFIERQDRWLATPFLARIALMCSGTGCSKT